VPKKGKRKTKTVALDARLHKEIKMRAVRDDVELTDLLNRIVKEWLRADSTDSATQRKARRMLASPSANRANKEKGTSAD
jgi:hypothetical protein